MTIGTTSDTTMMLIMKDFIILVMRNTMMIPRKRTTLYMVTWSSICNNILLIMKWRITTIIAMTTTATANAIVWSLRFLYISHVDHNLYLDEHYADEYHFADHEEDDTIDNDISDECSSDRQCDSDNESFDNIFNDERKDYSMNERSIAFHMPRFSSALQSSAFVFSRFA